MIVNLTSRERLRVMFDESEQHWAWNTERADHVTDSGGGASTEDDALLLGLRAASTRTDHVGAVARLYLETELAYRTDKGDE